MKRKILALCLPLYLLASDTTYKAVPIISSNPTSGTGIGALGVAMYKADKTSSPSQAILAAQYTDTDSYSIFGVNRLFFKNDKWQSNTFTGYIFNNSSFSFMTDMDVPTSIELPSEIDINFKVKIFSVLEQLLYKIKKDLYIGGQIFYVDQAFSAEDLSGQWFLKDRGIESFSRGGLGVTLSYDTRTKDEKFYPRDSTWINVSLSDFPKFLGSDTEFFNGLINARKYISFGKDNDVFALQYYGQFCSKDTPDGALAALGMKNIIRGYPIGKYKARYMNAFQTEYRYTILKTNFRIAPFVGYANLSGGSKGTEAGNRDGDNGNYYSGGMGVHYILATKYQLDYRIDVAYSNDDEVSVYASINQAF